MFHFNAFMLFLSYISGPTLIFFPIFCDKTKRLRVSTTNPIFCITICRFYPLNITMTEQVFSFFNSYIF